MQLVEPRWQRGEFIVKTQTYGIRGVCHAYVDVDFLSHHLLSLPLVFE